MTMIRFRWKYVDLRGEERGGWEVMPKGERAENRGKKRLWMRKGGERGGETDRC